MTSVLYSRVPIKRLDNHMIHHSQCLIMNIIPHNRNKIKINGLLDINHLMLWKINRLGSHTNMNQIMLL